MQRFWGKMIGLAACLATTAAMPAPALAQKLSGTIAGFECGDNCYLTLRTTGGAEVTGLCVAPQCAPWNEATKLPRRLIGARVTVTVGVGRQLDDSGNIMGDFKSFTAIRGLKP